MVENNGSQITMRSVLATAPNTGTGETHYETDDGRRWHATQPFERADGVIVGGRIYQRPGFANGGRAMT